ncbi:hypothetical protein [Pararhizobium antarcticum]|uniref:hypothetical protein n=1 Tax=Pararhizobium antarcticum TaxID=1798805 RepID=UPI000A8FE294|nr:hypothetical protein [Pararhizobium antarcticum]
MKMMIDNKKGRGETAPTFVSVALSLVPVHPWSKGSSDEDIANIREVLGRSPAMPMEVI